MKIGYPCLNRSVGCTSSHTFRLQAYSKERLRQTVADNLRCLLTILRYNVAHNLLHFRITSDLVPFASHPICQFDWVAYFQPQFQELGAFIRTQGLRISLHPDQFTLLNSPAEAVFEASARELRYHTQLLDALGLDTTAKIQLHVGGVYGDRGASLRRFRARFIRLEPRIQQRLVIENDERSFSVSDCLGLSAETGLPVVCDVFHHQLNPAGQLLREALDAAVGTWKIADGLPIVDYSSQEPGARVGKHAETIDPTDFRHFLDASRPLDFDLMLEIKDKEQSALQALQIAAQDPRLT